MSEHFIDLFLAFDRLVTAFGQALVDLINLVKLAYWYATIHVEDPSFADFPWYAAHYFGAAVGSTVLKTQQRR